MKTTVIIFNPLCLLETEESFLKTVALYFKERLIGNGHYVPIEIIASAWKNILLMRKASIVAREVGFSDEEFMEINMESDQIKDFYEKTLNTKSSKIIWLVDISIEEIAKKITSNFKITKEDFDPKLLNVTCVQNFSYGVIKI